MAATGCLDDAPIDSDVLELKTDDAVVGLQAQLFEPGKIPAAIHSSRRLRIEVAEHVESAIRS